MSADLVKRLQVLQDDLPYSAIEFAADRIEELERELAEANTARDNSKAKAQRFESLLAAEKALADRLAEDLEGYREAIDPDCKDSCCQYARETEVVLDAYRKARGL